MTSLTPEQISEIAGELDFGNRCFVHRQSGRLLFTPDFDNNIYAEKDLFKDELDELERNSIDYIEIERPQSSDSFEIMEKFADLLIDNNKLQNLLMDALKKKKPFQEFKFVIDNSSVYRQQWFDFKKEQLLQWAADKFKDATYVDRKNGSS